MLFCYYIFEGKCFFIPASNEPSGHACMYIWRLPRGSNTPMLAAGALTLYPISGKISQTDLSENIINAGSDAAEQIKCISPLLRAE